MRITTFNLEKENHLVTIMYLVNSPYGESIALRYDILHQYAHGLKQINNSTLINQLQCFLESG